MHFPIKEEDEVDARLRVLQTRILSLLERAINLEIELSQYLVETDEDEAGGDVAMEVDVEDTKPTDADAEGKANGDGNV